MPYSYHYAHRSYELLIYLQAVMVTVSTVARKDLAVSFPYMLQHLNVVVRVAYSASNFDND